MSELICSASNCINYEHGLCARPVIRIDGDNAQRSRDTFCNSFSHRFPGAANQIFSDVFAEKSTDIKCSTEECAYNRENCCMADSVEISGSGASESGETECVTFKRK